MSDAGAASWLLQLCTVVGVFFVAKGIFNLLWCLVTHCRVLFATYVRKRDLATEYGGKWAVVTGSTDGIGKEYAWQLAQKGMNIVLISRTLEKLKKVEQEIRKEFGVDTHIIQADFANGHEIYEGIAEGLKDKDIGILVNNVGYLGLPTKYAGVTEEAMWRFVHVNIVSVLAMTKVVLPQMMARKCGAIINISSISALSPWPYFAMYAATKAPLSLDYMPAATRSLSFVSSFSKALELECRQSGITVQTVQPGRICTNMTSYASSFRQPSMINASPDAYVSNALTTLGYNKTTAGTWSHTFQTFVINQSNEQLLMSHLANHMESIMEEVSDKTQ